MLYDHGQNEPDSHCRFLWNLTVNSESHFVPRSASQVCLVSPGDTEVIVEESEHDY
jgi:hypothetical protein